jgi:membrane associated rhomboid family serine protease
MGDRDLSLNSFLLPGLFVLIMWFVFLAEFLFGTSFSWLGINPREFSGLVGIVFSPFLHGDLNHILSNTAPMLILGFLTYLFYRPVFFRVYLYGALITGFWVWVAARPSYHIGASGLIYCLASFLFFSGLFRKSYRLMAVSLLVVFAYGGLIWGIFPFDWTVSWESHLLGGIAGLTLSIYYRRRLFIPKKKYSWEDGGDNLDDLEARYGERYWEGEDRTSRNTTITYIFKEKKD